MSRIKRKSKIDKMRETRKKEVFNRIAEVHSKKIKIVLVTDREKEIFARAYMKGVEVGEDRKKVEIRTNFVKHIENIMGESE